MAITPHTCFDPDDDADNSDSHHMDRCGDVSGTIILSPYAHRWQHDMLAKLAGHHLIPVGLNADGETLTCVELTQRCGDLFGKIFDLPVAETYASSLPSVPPWLRG